MTKKMIPVAALMVAASLPFGCADLSRTPMMPTLFKGVSTGIVPMGGSLTVNVRIPSAGFKTKVANTARAAYLSTDVARVELKLYAKNGVTAADHNTFDYLGGADGGGGAGATVLFTSSAYSWAAGVDTNNTDNKYTISNIPISATSYIVVARAYKEAGQTTNMTKSDSNTWEYARSSNCVRIAAGTTTYKDLVEADTADTALQLNIPLADAVGAPADVTTTFTNGGAGAAISGADS